MNITRPLFWMLYYLFARHLPGNYTPYSFGSKKIRAFICKPLFKKFGKNVDIGNKVVFNNLRESEIGDHSGIGAYSQIGTVRIGRQVMMGSECLIITQNHRFDDPDKPMREQGLQEDEPVIIEDDVWIGHRVIILPGVQIGRGSIIGAGSVVTRNVEAYAVMAGNPARLIRKRNENKGS